MNAIEQMAGGPIAAFEARYQSELGKKRAWNALFVMLFVAALIGSIVVSDFNLPGLATGLPKAWNYIAGTLPHLHWETLASDFSDWYWGWKVWLRLLVETILMGFVGTAVGGIGALLLCFSASRNLIANNVVYFATRRVLELFRTVPELVFALIFVFAFGLGPFGGVLAIAVHTVGALGKLFAEVNENLDQRAIEGTRAAGGNWPMVMRLAVLPQALPNYASYFLLRFEINVRGATTLGVVGAGGIGQELYIAIRQFNYTDISAILLLLILTTAIIDLSCEAIRHRLIGQDFSSGY